MLLLPASFILSCAFVLLFHVEKSSAFLVKMNFLSFYLSQKVLISPGFLKDNFPRDSVTGYQVIFSPSTLYISSHSLLPFKVSTEKFADNLMERPCMWQILLLWCSQNSLFVFEFWPVNYHMSWCGFYCIYFIWRKLGPLDLEFHSLLQVWKVFSHYVFKYVFCPIVSTLFSFCSPDGIMSNNLSLSSLILTSDWSSLLLYSFSEFFSSALYPSVPKFRLVLFVVSIS